MPDICVVGLGYVGLPTACAFAQSGRRTVGVDIRSDLVDGVNRGETHLSESGISRAVKREVKEGRLIATTDLRTAVSGSAVVVIAVQTPYEGGKAVLSHLRSACEEVASSIRRGSVVIVESTVPPGTCENLVLPIFRKHGKRDGKDFFFAYCPERIAPGNSLEEFRNNDRIIGAGNKTSHAKALETMRWAVKGNLLATDMLTAETTKLVENAARDVYIGFANDLAKICSRIGVDVREVIELANTHPRVKILRPGIGVGGPCLTKDPYFLLEALGENPEGGAMIREARAVNNSMKDEVLRLVSADGGLQPGSKVAVLGTSYKPDIDDPRSSPSEPVIRSLIGMGYEVSAYDPYCKEGFGARMAESLTEATSGASCVFLLVAHTAFGAMSIEELATGMAPHPLIIDAAGVSKPDDVRTGEYRLRRLGDGRNRATDSSKEGKS
jgi:UDP-N-acetyl-D-mannosaminuronic acid dehydrogenase